MADPDGTSLTLQFSVPPSGVDPVHDLLATLWADVPSVSPLDRMRFETALVELTSNVIRHATSEVGVSCSLRVAACEDHLEATLRDTGEPGNVELTGRIMPDADDLAESGRGIPLIQALVDEVSYSRTGEINQWHIMSKLES